MSGLFRTTMSSSPFTAHIALSSFGDMIARAMMC
jgi:hypothetical protein